MTSPTAISGLYKGGPADPGTPKVVVDASGQPTSFEYYGKPGTATLLEFQSGSGWVIGRYGNGTFDSGSALTFAANDSMHFASQLPNTNLPTSGTAKYTLAAYTLPTVPGGAATITAPQLTMTLGVAFGSAAKFGYEGGFSGQRDGQAASFQFATAGGADAPSLTNAFLIGGGLALFGTAPLTGVSANLCATAADCTFNANFISGGDKAATFAVSWGLYNKTDKASVLNGAGILTQSTQATTPPATGTTPTPTPTTSVFDPAKAQVLISDVGSAGSGQAGGNSPATYTLAADGSVTGFTYDLNKVKWSIGTAQASEVYVSPNILIGRWTGGTATEFTPASPFTAATTTDRPYTATQGLHYILTRPMAAADLPTSGMATYSLVSATRPTSLNGPLGTLTLGAAILFGSAPKLALDGLVTVPQANGSDLTLKFVTAGGLADPSKSELAIAFYQSGYFQNGTFFGKLNSVTDSLGNCAANGGCSVNINGALAGKGDELALDYLIVAGQSGNYTGAAVLKSNGITSTPPPSQSAMGTLPSGADLILRSYGVPFFGTGSANIVTVTLGADGKTVDQVDSTKRGTAVDKEIGGIDGIVGWTRWAGGTLAGSSTTTVPENGGGGFVYGVRASELPTSGTASYAMVGSTAIVAQDGSVAPGQVNSAALEVDFAALKVGFTAAMTVGGQSYTAESSGGLGAHAFTMNADGTFNSAGNWTITGNGCSASANCAGRVAGFLAGKGGTHAGVGLSFSTAPTGGTQVSTAIAFKK